jgi:outer membrane protein assembly factor BamB
MKTGIRLVSLLLFGLMAVSAADILFWYHVERRPPLPPPRFSVAPHLVWTRAIDALAVTWTPPMLGTYGALYVASAAGVHALDRSGAEIWVYRVDASDPITGGALSEDEQGNLYFATAQSLYSLSPFGLKRWQTDCPRAALAQNAAGNRLEGDAVYATCENHFSAFSKNDGRETWRLPNFEAQAPSLTPTAPLILRNGELVFSRDQQIIATNKRGSIRWIYPPDNRGAAYALGSGTDDVIYARSFSGDLLGLYFNGSTKWTFHGGPATGFNEPPVRAADGTLYVVAPQGPLFAFAPDARVKWKFPLPPSTTVVGYSTPVLGASGAIYQLLEDRVLAISSQGKMLWQLQLPGEPRHHGFLVLAADGTLYAVMDNSFVHAIGTAN